MSERGREQELQPIPQSREAFDWLASYGNHQVEASMARMARLVRGLVPECVALSLTAAHGEFTFTLMADRPGAALLDAMQYLDHGPCEAAVEEGATQATSNLATDEGRWQWFAKGEAVVGISSTLSLPVIGDGRVVGSVNLYASTPDAFDGRHDELGLICGAWAGGAVTNADLSFTSRIRASTTHLRLKDRGVVDIATGYVAAYKDVEIGEAVTLIHEASARADVTPADFARFILAAHSPHEGEEED
jgi:GAF domain-containing protein